MQLPAPPRAVGAWWCILAALLLSAVVPSSLAAQGDATFTASSGAGVEGDAIAITVTVNHTIPASGYSFGLTCDPAVADVGTPALSASVQAVNAGAGPTFVNLANFTTFEGFQYGVIFDFFGSELFTAGTDHEICNVTVTIVPGAPVGTSAIDLRSDAVDPGNTAVQILATGPAGEEMLSVGVDGTLQVLSSAPTATLSVAAQGAPTEAGATATAVVSLVASLDIDGFSFGLAHDAAVLSLPAGSVVMGADLAAVRGGLGPEFLSIDLFANGFTFGVVLNTSVPGPGLAANLSHEVAVVSYAVAPTAPYGSTALTFTDALGTPPVLRSVGMGLVNVEPPDVVNDSLFVARRFMRGDVNQNGQVTISDIIGLLAMLFANAPIPCAESADLDSSQALTISDPIYGLVMLFDNGPPIAAPFGLCELPPQPPALSCDSFICP